MANFSRRDGGRVDEAEIRQILIAKLVVAERSVTEREREAESRAIECMVRAAAGGLSRDDQDARIRIVAAILVRARDTLRANRTSAVVSPAEIASETGLAARIVLQHMDLFDTTSPVYAKPSAVINAST